MAKAVFRVDDGLGEVVISDPPLNLFEGARPRDLRGPLTTPARASHTKGSVSPQL